MESTTPLGPLRLLALALSGSLELDPVLGRASEIIRSVIPCDDVFIAYLVEDGTVRAHAFTWDGQKSLHPGTVGDSSAALRLALERTITAAEAGPLLDPSYPADRWLQSRGYQSGISLPLAREAEVMGTLAIVSRTPAAYPASDLAFLAAAADLIVMALGHERLWRAGNARRDRLNAIDGLLLAMADAIDVREIFERVSAVAAPVLPHDRMLLVTPAADEERVDILAMSGEPVAGALETLPMRERYLNPDLEYEIFDDVASAAPIDSGTRHFAKVIGACSALRIPLRMNGGVLGALIFVSVQPARYRPDDVPVARRIADHVSLALAHQRLAEEARQLEEERRRSEALEGRVESLRRELDETAPGRRIIGESPSWKAVLSLATRVAPTDTTVFLTGETGTGKEVVARFIHRASHRAGGPFVGINCAALPETLLESELFGHEKGAFTGATASRAGRIELAAGGTLFLDEVTEMSLVVQSKLLRVLEEREYYPLGAAGPRKADVRVIAASNRDLGAAIRKGTFRDDLYYRLRVFEIRLPPLRERRDDILPMAEAFLEDIGRSMGRPAAGISRAALRTLMSYSFPGNVRELRNAMERATILCDGGLITVEHLPMGEPDAMPAEQAPRSGAPETMSLMSTERDLILQALSNAGNNRSLAARLLGVTRSQLHTRMRRHGIQVTAEARTAEPKDD